MTEFECVWLNVYVVVVVGGGGKAEIPHPTVWLPASAGSEIQKEEGMRELGHHGRGEVCAPV